MYVFQCLKNILIIIPLFLFTTTEASFYTAKTNGDKVLHYKLNDQQIEARFVARRSGSLKRLGKQVSLTRKFDDPVTQKDKKDIRFIVKTLSDSSLPSLLIKKKELEKAGDRIDHIHPLKFYAVIFSDEELKVSLINIRSRSWVWGEFFSGMSEALADEKKLNNLTIPQIEEFCTNLGVDKTPIIAALNENRWTDFVDNLIKQLPRKGNPGRYDM